jgi:hypothetical protein
LGPLEILVIASADTVLNDAITRALASAVECGSLHVVDAAVIIKDACGKITIRELAEPENKELAVSGAVHTAGALLSVEEIERISAQVASSSSAIVMVVEHISTPHLENTILAGNGWVRVHERVSPAVALAALRGGAARPGTAARNAPFCVVPISLWKTHVPVTLC